VLVVVYHSHVSHRPKLSSRETQSPNSDNVDNLTSNIVDIGVALVATVLIVFAVVKGRDYGYHQQRHRVHGHNEGEEVDTDLEAGAAEQQEDGTINDASSIWSANDDQEVDELS